MVARRKTLTGLLIILAVALWGHTALAVDVQRVESKGGVTALLVEDHTNPIINVRFVFRGGSALDPNGMEGLANMVSGLLDEGAGQLDSQAFQQRLEELVVSLSFSASRDTFGGSLSTLTRTRDEAFSLLQLALSQPRFDEEPVQRIRSQILANLRHESEDPDAIAGKTLFRTLFDGHVYGRPKSGSPETVNAITSQALHTFVSERFARNNLVIGVVGDITANELATLLDETFGDLPAEASDWAIANVAPPATGSQVVVRKNVPQSAILFAQKGPKRDDPDFYAAYVMNYVLGGGGFSSRLYSEVREKRGLAYSVYSYLTPYDYAALILGGSGTANARVTETLDVLRSEWKRLADNGVSEEELADAKTYLTGSYPLRFTASGRIAGMLTGIQLDNLGMDYFDKRNTYIDAVTLEDVNRVARQWLDPDDLTIVIVGEPENL